MDPYYKDYPMHYLMRSLIITLAALLCFANVHAQSTDQNYPVTAQPFILSRSNQRLSPYFSSGPGRRTAALTVGLLLKDLTKNSIQVYLKWSMAGRGRLALACGCQVWTGIFRRT